MAAPSMSTFQAATYGSFVLTFILAGFAAVVLYRKGLDTVERRFSDSSKILAVVFALMAMHGFFATYNFTRYLKQTAEPPISLTLLFWIILGLGISYATNRLLREKLKKFEVAIDGFFFAVIFTLVTLAVSPETTTNTSLILSLVALSLFTVPFARFNLTYKAVKRRIPGLQHKSAKRLLNTLVLSPGILLLVVVFYTFDFLGDDTILLFTNLISLIFILLVSVSFLAAIKTLQAEQAEAAQAAETADAPKATTAEAPQTDPLLEQLLAEEQAAQEAAPATAPKSAPKKPSRADIPKKPSIQPPPPPEKGSAAPKAPKKPIPPQKGADKPAPNSPSKIKAPAKPKKRF